jgi:hypothetical protein
LYIPVLLYKLFHMSAAEWKCVTVVVELAANHMPLQGVGHAWYPNKWYLSPLCTPFVGAVSPSSFPLHQCHDWLSVSQVVWTQIHVHWWMNACIYRQWIVWKTAGVWPRGLVAGLFICGSSHSACQKLILQCVMVNELWIGKDVEASGCGIIWGTVQNMFWEIKSAQPVSGLRFECVAFWDVLVCCWILIELPDPKDEGATVIQNTGNYLPNNAE